MIWKGGFLAAASPSVASIVSVVTEVVTASVTWIKAFVACIVGEPLLLMFVTVTFVGLGVGLIRRIIGL